MKSYGNFGKAIGDKVNASLQSSLENVTLPEYNRFIADAVLATYEKSLNELALPQIKALLDEKLAPVPAQMTGEQFLNGIKEAYLSWSHADAYEIELSWNDDRDCCIEIIINDDVRVTLYDHKKSDRYYIGYLANNQRVYSGPLFNSTNAFGVDAYLYQLYCARTEITEIGAVTGCNIELRDY